MKIPDLDEVHVEHVVVRTHDSGQALRVQLVCDTRPLPESNWEYYGPTDDMVVAELVIAPNHRLLVESGGVKVEFIKQVEGASCFTAGSGDVRSARVRMLIGLISTLDEVEQEAIYDLLVHRA